ncbi:MAG: orotidine-5'-phosphate decarboxylase [Bacteroidales bacterium]|nr:orotidine-5'-phosphate decarboxylase [Bacteroidales bacterium]
MNRKQLTELIKTKQSFLCVGLDSDINKIPKHLLATEDPVFEFNKQIIDATIDVTVAYKPNIAFYESRGIDGWKSLQRTMDYLEQYKNEAFTIADAKRGDIGNTSKQYALSFFEKQQSGMSFDSVTVAPYMGEDSVTPFLEFENKWVILLALTSNKGAFDLQFIENKENGKKLFEEVLTISQNWGNADNMMYVVGATKADMLEQIRKIIPDHFLLVPGVGAQGGSLEEVSKYGMNQDCGLLVNSSRGIIFKSSEIDFAEVAKKEAEKLQQQMAVMLDKFM